MNIAELDSASSRLNLALMTPGEPDETAAPGYFDWHGTRRSREQQCRRRRDPALEVLERLRDRVQFPLLVILLFSFVLP